MYIKNIFNRIEGIHLLIITTFQLYHRLQHAVVMGCFQRTLHLVQTLPDLGEVVRPQQVQTDFICFVLACVKTSPSLRKKSGEETSLVLCRVNLYPPWFCVIVCVHSVDCFVDFSKSPN